MASLLDELRKHSVIDLDCNDDAGGFGQVDFKREVKFMAVALEFKPFQDMTSNQLIVLGQLKQEKHAHIIDQAAKKARECHTDFPGVTLADLTVDFATALLGIEVAKHLHPIGYVHAQTNVSLAYDASATIAHAQRLVKVYGIAGLAQTRICIKIPSTAEGIAACSTLENKHNIRTLATTCFCLAQGLAAAEAKCTYVAPYINPLHVHLEDTHVFHKDPLANLTGLQVTFIIQDQYKQKNSKTKVLAASLVTAEEMFALCGIQHITISAAGLALLQKTPLDKHFEDIRDRSLAYDATQYDKSSAFFTVDLDAALKSEEVSALMADALKHFGKAENQLRKVAENALH